MRILYNALSAKLGGGLSYSTSQLEALSRRGEVQLTVLTAPWNHDHLRGRLPASIHLHQVELSGVLQRFRWEQRELPRIARAHDLLLSPGNFATMRSPVPQVLILQNPNYVGEGRRLSQARDLPLRSKVRRRWKIWFSHRSMMRADLVVSISDALTEEVRSEPALQQIRLVTVKSGAPTPPPREEVRSLTEQDEVEHLVGGSRYVLSVANDYPHKRLEDLAGLASHMATVEHPDRPLVVLVGHVTPTRRLVLSGMAGVGSPALVFLGPVSDPAMVRKLYRCAVASVSTSELESWGLTLHEAAAQGTPVVVTDIPPHRELMERRARYFPVGDVEALASTIDEVALEPRPAPWLYQRSWDDHAQELVVAMRSVIR